MELLPKAGVLSPPPGDEVTAGAPSASAFPVESLPHGDLDVLLTFKVNPLAEQGRQFPGGEGGVLSWEG